jgi:two-component system LytT family response regulator
MTEAATPKPEPIRAVIADDEVLARRYLAELLDPLPEIELVAECKNGFDTIKAISELEPDIVFLDIQMPKLDGFEVVELIDRPIAVIFVTAYDEYAVRAFDAHAVDYLLKPFTKERLCQSIEKARRRIDSIVRPGGLDPSPAALKAAARPAERYLSRVVIKEGDGVVILSEDDIDYIRAEDDYVSIHSDGRCWLKLQTISSLARSLNPKKFVRIHRSAIANIDRIARIERQTKDRRAAEMNDSAKLPISRSGRKRLEEALRTTGDDI